MKASKAPADQAADLANQDVGYKDMLVNVKMYKDLEGKDFHIAELQVHLAGMIEAKSNKAKGGHLMYRVIRQQQEVIDGKGTTSRFGAQHKHFDTDADWSELTPIEEIPGKADKAAIQAFLPDAEVDKIVAEFGGIPRAQAQVNDPLLQPRLRRSVHNARAARPTQTAGSGNVMSAAHSLRVPWLAHRMRHCSPPRTGQGVRRRASRSLGEARHGTAFTARTPACCAG